MAVKAPVKIKYPDNVSTKIVGVTHDGRQDLLKRCADLNVQALEVVRDSENRYDPDAVALDAVLYADGNREIERMRLGFIGNSDRVCLQCGKLVEGGTFQRSRTVKCPECGHLAQFMRAGSITCRNEITDRSAGAMRACNMVFDTDMHKTVVCPTCFGDMFSRDGLASAFARAMDDGVKYHCTVESYTGGACDEKGKVKTRGCNIRIERAEADKPV